MLPPLVPPLALAWFLDLGWTYEGGVCRGGGNKNKNENMLSSCMVPQTY